MKLHLQRYCKRWVWVEFKFCSIRNFKLVLEFVEVLECILFEQRPCSTFIRYIMCELTLSFKMILHYVIFYYNNNELLQKTINVSISIFITIILKCFVKGDKQLWKWIVISFQQNNSRSTFNSTCYKHKNIFLKENEINYVFCTFWSMF